MPTPADNLLPVWTLRPNWETGINERLEWLTDLLTASDGNEQARAMRLSPRREFECVFTPWDEDRSYFDLWLHRFGSQEFMVPLFHDTARLSAQATISATTLSFDNTNREFVTGGMAVMIGESPMEFQSFTILAQDDNGITIAPPYVNRVWPKGSKVHPLRRARLSQESQLEKLTNRVATATVIFQLNQANDISAEGVWSGLEYEGLPVLTDPPNYAESLSSQYLRMAFNLDNEHGLRFLADDAGRAFTVQAHSYQFRGRTEHMEFRKMLYRLRGRAKPIWLPTFNQDMRLARAASAADNKLSIKSIGYGYTGGNVAGRDHVLIDGTIPRRITGLSAPLASGEERLDLSAPVGANIPKGRSASFLAPSRMNQDSVEIVHHSDTDGVGECKTTFKQFTNTRVAPAIISAPIPESAFNFAFCGVPDESEIICVPFDNTPDPVFEGWYTNLRLEMYNSNVQQPSFGWIFTVTTPGAPSSFSLGSSSNYPPTNYFEYLPDNGGMDMYYGIDLARPQTYRLRQQWGSGSRPPGLAFRMYGRRWDGAEEVLFPQPGSDAMANADGIFGVGQIFPYDYFFTF